MGAIWQAIVAHFSAITPAFLIDLATDYGVFLMAALGLYVFMSAGPHCIPSRLPPTPTASF